MKRLVTCLAVTLLLTGCGSNEPDFTHDFELSASFRGVDMETGQPWLWLRHAQAVPVLRFVLDKYEQLCEGVQCQYRAAALENLITSSELGSPQYELARYAEADPALQYIVDEMFPLLVQVHNTGDNETGGVVFIESAHSSEPGELIDTSQASTAVITARDGTLFRALASGKPDELLSVDCVTAADKRALGERVHDRIRLCPEVDVVARWQQETDRLLDAARLAWEKQEHRCGERPCHGLYTVEYFGEQRYALINWGQFERFISSLDYQVCSQQEHVNAWACLLDIATEQ